MDEPEDNVDDGDNNDEDEGTVEPTRGSMGRRRIVSTYMYLTYMYVCGCVLRGRVSEATCEGRARDGSVDKSLPGYQR